MELYGSIADNLKAAVESSRRLKGHPIHKDTLQFWSDLIREARARKAAGGALDRSEVDEAISELEVVLVEASG
jgi:hypothetical protein